MRWLVTGAGGMLGVDLVDLLQSSGDDVVGVVRSELDIRDPQACRQAVVGFDTVVNCAAWTDVDGAESAEGGAFAVNAVGAANLARACQAASAVMVQLSTDYVFAGDATSPYPIDAPLAPINAYGRTKAAGEWAVRAECPEAYVVRTAWLYGEHGQNFVAMVLRLAGEREVLNVVDDQHGQPTWTRDLAKFLRLLVVSGAPFGTYHGTASGVTTWFGLAQAVFRARALDPGCITATTSADFVRPAARPKYGVLDNHDQLPDWRDGLSRALASSDP